MEEGRVSYPDAGSPQGGVISPLAANVYLHYVLDDWFEQVVQPRLQGQARLVRYADDFTILFELEADARRVMAALPKRMERYGLSIHPTKTRMVDFRPPRHRPTDGKRRPPGRTFDLLGFTHYWGRSRRDTWVVKRKTASKRLTRAVQTISRWCRTNRHEPIAIQHVKLSEKIRGHYAYYGITGNGKSLTTFLNLVQREWCRWLNRRNRKRKLRWTKFRQILSRYPLPPIRIVHSIYGRTAKP
jgi:hypothetical protein